MLGLKSCDLTGPDGVQLWLFRSCLRCEADLFQLSNAALTASPLYLEFLFAQLQEQKPEPHVLLVAVLNANSECSKCCTSYNNNCRVV